MYYNNVGTISSSQTTQDLGSQGKGTDELGKDEFLKLLITQLQYQDPMDPMNDQEFIAQLAQFSSLEQMQNLNTNMTSMMMAQQQLTALTQATQMIGQTVELMTKDGENLFGKVSGVQFKDSWPRIVVDGAVYDFDEIVSILEEVE